MKSHIGINTDELLRTLTEAMTRIDLNNYRDKTNPSILGSPFRKLPDCSEFNINLGAFDEHLAAFNLRKKTPAEIIMKGGITKPSNRYLEHQVIRLQKCIGTGNSRLFWHLCQVMLKRSNVLRVSAFHRVVRNGHRNYPLSKIYNGNRKVSRIINLNISEIDSKRIYIDKANGGVRPLGVPAMEGRIYLHMLNLFLTMGIQPHLSKSQHGFQPHKGTLTAGKEFFTHRLYDSKYIHEYDFKGFFDNVNLKEISRKLTQINVPFEISNLLETLNRKSPKNDYDPSVQTEMDRRLAMREEATTLMYAGKPGSREIIQALLTDLKLPGPSARTLRENDCTSIQEYIQYTGAIQESLGYGNIDVDLFNRGVGQGYPTSPILSMLIMEDWLKPTSANVSPIDADVKLLAYADDSLAFSDSEFTLSTPVPVTASAVNGLESFVIKPEGSGWVKFDGQGLKPLKFLGLVFDGQTLKSSTRSGKTLVFAENVQQALRLIELKKFEKLVDTLIKREIKSIKQEMPITTSDTGTSMVAKCKGTHSFAALFRSSLIGFVQSRLYQGNWDLTQMEQDFNLHFIEKSMTSYLVRKRMRSSQVPSVFTASTFACQALVELFRKRSRIRHNRKLMRPGSQIIIKAK